MLTIASPTLPMKNLPWRRHDQVTWTILEFSTPWNISRKGNAKDFKFCIRVGEVLILWWLTKWAWSGHVSNFCTLDFKNVTTASHLYIDMVNKCHRQWACGLHLCVSWLKVYYTLVNCDPLMPLLRFVLDLYNFFLHCYAAVGNILTDTLRCAVHLR